MLGQSDKRAKNACPIEYSCLLLEVLAYLTFYLKCSKSYSRQRNRKIKRIWICELPQ